MNSLDRFLSLLFNVLYSLRKGKEQVNWKAGIREFGLFSLFLVLYNNIEKYIDVFNGSHM